MDPWIENLLRIPREIVDEQIQGDFESDLVDKTILSARLEEQGTAKPRTAPLRRDREARQTIYNPNLPAGWKMYRDSEGLPYFYNIQTDETTWTSPLAPPPAAQPPAHPQLGRSVSAPNFNSAPPRGRGAAAVRPPPSPSVV